MMRYQPYEGPLPVTNADIEWYAHHLHVLLLNGNPAHLRLCCGLDEAIKGPIDHETIRRWLETHEDQARKSLCYAA